MAKYILLGFLAWNWVIPSPARGESYVGIGVQRPAVKIKTVVNDKEYQEAEMVHGDVYIPRDSVVKRDVVARDGVITIDGKVEGDAVVFGGSVIINGALDGDAVAIGGTAEALGTISGDVAAIGGSVDISGKVGGDIAAIGGNLSLDSNAVINGDIVVIGGVLEKREGAVVKGNVAVLSLGFLNKLIPKFVNGLRIGKLKVEVNIPPVVSRLTKLAITLVWFIGIFILVLLITLIFPRPTRNMADATKKKPLITFLVGFGGELAISPLMLILVITIIGIPLIPLAFLGILIAFLMGWAGIALAVGEWLKKNWGWQIESPLALMALGFLAIALVTIVSGLFRLAGGPVGIIGLILAILGILVIWVAITFGFGACLLTRFGTKPQGG